ncbi:hypothetical protein Mal15_68930 [Stieleria maiorica]|uniref:Uncharacterized protein n=1 Tax=Stieleria maiorica TaxID=2795974 RepID=A0A5B9MMZ3_9BACT|nr:hypothetical protein Mal15_68930 [Stieleria maiorica]
MRQVCPQQCLSGQYFPSLSPVNLTRVQGWSSGIGFSKGSWPMRLSEPARARWFGRERGQVLRCRIGLEDVERILSILLPAAAMRLWR